MLVGVGLFGRNGFGEILCRGELWGVRVDTEHKGVYAIREMGNQGQRIEDFQQKGTG